MQKFKSVILTTIGFPIFYNICSIVPLFFLTLIFCLFLGIAPSSLIASPKYSGIFESLLYIFTALFVFYMLKKITKFSKETIKTFCSPNKLQLKNLIYISMFFFGFSVFFNMLINIFYEMFPDLFKSYEEVTNSIESSLLSPLGFLEIIILAPIFEEIFFRGIIFGYLKKNFKLSIAIIIQAISFGIFHHNLFQGLYAFLMGLVLGIIFTYFNSIYASITGHMIFNLFGVMFSNLLFSTNLVSTLTIVISLILMLFGGYKIIVYKNLNKKTC